MLVDDRPILTAQPTGLAGIIAGFLGLDVPVRIDCYDGTALGPPDAATRIVVRSADALRYILTAPGELGFARAYVAGEIDIDGDVFDVLALRDRMPHPKVSPGEWLALLREVGAGGLRFPRVPSEEMHAHGRLHSRARDAAAIAHHYDVSNEFYRIVLGPTMTYSCGVWSSDDVGLDAAQVEKYELICRKLGLHV